MNEFRNLVLRLLQVVWIIFAIFIVFSLGILLLTLVLGNGNSSEEIIAVIFGFCLGALGFIFLMLSIQYILFSSWNLNDLFDGSLMR